MFDLDIIEKDWKNNSFKLSEKEIIEIYRSEGVTLSKYYEEIEEYRKNTRMDMSAEERLLRIIFGDTKIEEQEKSLREKFKFPSKKRLSIESQRKVVEGCLYMVFDSTREWYNFFENKISMEKIYYVCLEALMNCAKYTMHCEKPVFKFYVSKSIERNIIKYVSKWEHITYREAYKIINNINYYDNLEEEHKKIELSFNYEKEEAEKPSTIFYKLKNEYYNVDYIKNISSNEFMEDYNKAVDNLDNVARMIMQFSFDTNGNRGFTSKEIGEYLGINKDKISNIRRQAIKTLRKDVKINTYKY